MRPAFQKYWRVLPILCAWIVGLQTPTRVEAAEKMPVPADLQVVIALRMIALDRTLESRCGDSVRVMLLYANNDPASIQARDQISATMKNHLDKQIKKLPWRYSAMAWNSPDSLEARLKRDKTYLLYVMPGNSANLAAIAKVTQKLKITTVSGLPEYADRGLSLSVGLKGDKVDMLVNLCSAKAEGCDFDPKLLQIATTIKCRDN